jgi:hypothetical protein
MELLVLINHNNVHHIKEHLLHVKIIKDKMVQFNVGVIHKQLINVKIRNVQI